MADFNIALALLYKQEGGYVPSGTGDPGGETYCGISRKYWPQWQGWEYIDSLKSAGIAPGLILHSLDEAVAEFYRTNFWMHWMDSDSSQTRVNFAFSMSVNEGITLAHQIAQNWNDPLIDISVRFLDHYRTRPQADIYFCGWSRRVLQCVIS